LIVEIPWGRHSCLPGKSVNDLVADAFSLAAPARGIFSSAAVAKITGMIITIDGPAGSGKSTAARGLAARLGFEFLDTGAMYRAVAFALRRADIDFADAPRVSRLLADFHLEMPPGRIELNGEEITRLIRTPEIASDSSKVAVHAHVRSYLVEQQRKIARGRNMVCEGRDQGTVVFPQAERKFFLVADPVARAERRYHEMRSRGLAVDLECVLADQRERDARDESNAISPLHPADDAIVIDTSEMTAGQVLARLEEDVRRCLPG
jgi:CMP/dCMP kinase